MINAKMRLYDYFTLDEKDEYGQPTLPTKDTEPAGQIKISIFPTTKSIIDNIQYSNCSYLGLTKNKVDDTYIINYENRLLKVLYVIPGINYKQVFMADIV